MSEEKKQYSRRDFARRAAIFSVAAPLAGASRITDSQNAADNQQIPKLPPNFPKLSDQSLAEVEERYQSILKQYPGRFSSDQKSDLRRLSFVAQPSLDKLRAYTIQNGDSPALYLKPTVERDKKPAKPSSAAVTPVAKKS
jgi:hypothetical protein